MSNPTNMDDKKNEIDHINNVHDHTNSSINDAEKQPHLLLRTEGDNQTILSALWTYRKTALICMMAAFSASLDGYQGHLNSSITSNAGFIKQFGNGKLILDATWVSIWGGTASAGQTLAQFCMPFVTDRFGRKPALWLTFLLLMGSIFAESFARTNPGWLIAKILSGAGVGAMQGTLPMYISELSPTQLRGLFTNAYTFWYVLGQLLSPVCLQVLSKINPDNYLDAVYSQWGMIGGLLICYAFLPESPWWLVSKDKDTKALKSLNFLYSGTPNYNAEQHMAIMRQTITEERIKKEGEKQYGISAIFRGINGWRLVVAMWPKMMQQFCGLSVFNSYATYFFQIAGAKDPFLVTVILACVQMMSMLITMALVDGYGRRDMVVYGYMVTVIADFGMGATGTQNVAKSASLGSLLIFWACLATFSTTSASAIGYSYLAEIPKQDLRAKSASWGLAIPNLFSILFSYTTPYMLKGNPATGWAGWGIETGFFFGCTGALVTAVGWFIMPETARRTPAEIDEMFEARVPPRKFKNYVTQVQLDYEEAVANQNGTTSENHIPAATRDNGIEFAAVAQAEEVPVAAVHQTGGAPIVNPQH